MWHALDSRFLFVLKDLPPWVPSKDSISLLHESPSLDFLAIEMFQPRIW